MINILLTLRDVTLALFIAILIPTTLFYGYEVFIPYPNQEYVELDTEGRALIQKINATESERPV